MTDEQMNSRFKHRRIIAQISFFLSTIVGIGLIVIAIRWPETQKPINDIRWHITALFGLWTTLILGYYIAASYEQGRMKQ